MPRPVLNILLSGSLLWFYTACGPSDSAQVDCRCTAETDVGLFPECFGVDLTGVRQDASSPLATRLPECPSAPRIPLLEPTRAEFVLANIEIAIKNFSPIQYLDQLTADFLFVPDESDLQLFPEVYPAPDGYIAEADIDTLWDATQERAFATSAFSVGRTTTVGDSLRTQGFKSIDIKRWYDAGRDADNAAGLSECSEISGLRECFEFPYEIDFIPATGSTISIQGRMEVIVVTPNEENPTWAVRRWQDFRDPASAKTSFTQFRAQFAQ